MNARRFSMHWLLGTLALVSFCGCSDDTVIVKGTVTMDGEAVDGGELFLNPVGEGPRAFALVNPEGQFQLVATGSNRGAFPGTYHVLYRNKVKLDARKQATLKRQAAGLDTSELMIRLQSPRKSPIVIPEAGTDDLVIAISRKEGWEQSIGD